MTTITLYGTQGSGSAAIEAALTLAGLEFAQIDASSWQPGPGLDALSKVNPLQQIPTLVLSDGEVLTESAAMLIELGLRWPQTGLLPDDERQRAQAIRGLVYIAANCYAAISIIDYPARWCAEADEDDIKRIRAGSRERLHLHWALFAEQFGAGFLQSGRPGALELLATVVSKWSGSRAFLQANKPQFHAQLLAVEQHVTVAAVFARHWPPQG